ncbi:torsin-1A-interacting protein 2-like [Poeciliopsis prolifica]|uniref:torsin-1A-interacting protein 2-like n=1 Tax=Poeciliopsis prolifica TaxID=188132 RepID=UPI0024130AA1|nr:torsin-1A-interacting protein 2-like [Poeciliopsis prolifica]
MESPPSYEHPEGSADPSAELSATPTGEATGRSSNDVEEENGQQTVDKDSGRKAIDESQDNSSSSEKLTDKTTSIPTENGQQTVDKDSGRKAIDESQDNSSSSEKLTGDHQSLSTKTTSIPTGEATGYSSDDVESVGGKNGQQTVDKDSGRKAIDESQDNSSSSEKLTGDHQSLSVTTGYFSTKTTSIPTGEATGYSSDDVESVGGSKKIKIKCFSSLLDLETYIIFDKITVLSTYNVHIQFCFADVESENGQQTVDKDSGRKAIDESQDNSSSSEKLTDKTTSTPTENGQQTVDKDSSRKAIDESQDNSSSSEKLTDKTTSIPTENGQQTVDKDSGRKAIDEVKTTHRVVRNYKTTSIPTGADSDEGNRFPPGQQPNDESQDNSSSEKLTGRRTLLVGVAIVALVAIVAQYYHQSKSQPQKTDWQQVDVFLKHMKNVKAKFPNQRAELWSRSEIHLKRHLQTSQPTEPVSLILTSGVRAERTMRCLAQGVASAFSTARNASILHIDGAGKAGQDSDQVKLDIDRKLQGAFEGDKPVAVIHRLEELPPGSTLIFYRYCDHENAAYKKTFLIFTVLLGDKEEIPAEMRLSIVEEMVDDYLQKKFLSHSHPVSFDRMDINKYGGLWSRISHLILPVAAEDRIEHEGC